MRSRKGLFKLHFSEFDLKVINRSNWCTPRLHFESLIVYIIMYINDLPDYLEHCDVTLYADDTVLFISDKSLHNMKSYMNSDMEKLTNWLKLNHLTLNLNS